MEATLNADYLNALPDAEHAVALAPDNVHILDTRGQVYFSLGRFDEAFVDLDRSIALGANFVAVFFSRGQIYERRGMKDLAIADYSRALELEPDGDIEKHAREKARERLKALGATP